MKTKSGKQILASLKKISDSQANSKRETPKLQCATVASSSNKLKNAPHGDTLQRASIAQHKLPSPETFCINRTRCSRGKQDGTVNFVDILNAEETEPGKVTMKRIVLSSFGVDLKWLFEDRGSSDTVNYAPAPILSKVPDIVLVHSSKELQDEYVRFPVHQLDLQ